MRQQGARSGELLCLPACSCHRHPSERVVPARPSDSQAEVVAMDEREGGVRATLNLGHTFGHAIETAAGYGTWLHGEAVSAGTVMAADLSHRLGWIDRDLYDRCAARWPCLRVSARAAGHT